MVKLNGCDESASEKSVERAHELINYLRVPFRFDMPKPKTIASAFVAVYLARQSFMYVCLLGRLRF